MSTAELTTLGLALDKFLQEQIAIPATARTSASTSQNYLRGVLRNKASADGEFPELLTKADADFLGGSFARHTKIWPLDDIDLFIPLNGGDLIYKQNGYRLPFRIETDTATTRLTLPKWKVGEYVSSIKVLEGFTTALQATYPSSEVSADHHCVNLQTTVAATSQSDGIGFDVVPCFLLKPDDGSEDFYLVPDGIGGWMRSNPRKDTELCADLQNYHGGTYRKAVRLLKYWNKTQLGDQFQSYYIELVVSKRFSQLKSEGKKVSYVAQALDFAFSALRDTYTTVGAATSLVAGAPDVQAPKLTEAQLATLRTDAANAKIAFNQAYNENSAEAAFVTMNAIFGVDCF
jgi:hypothetical protein